MLEVSTRPLTAEEREAIVEDSVSRDARWKIGCAVAGTILVAAVGALIASTLAAGLGRSEPRWALSGCALALTLVAIQWALDRPDTQRARRWARAWAGRYVDAHPLERWSFTPARGWAVTCSHTRGLLLETVPPEPRLIFLACRQLEDLPPGHMPTHIDMEVLPQLLRVLRLEHGPETVPVSAPTFTMEELGMWEQPVKRRRFAELAPERLPAAARSHVAPGTPGPPPSPVWQRTVTDRERRLRYVPPAAKGLARIVIALVPALAGGALLFPAVRKLAATPGATPGLFVIFVVACAIAIAIAERIRRRSVNRLIAGDVSAIPGAVALRGRVRALDAIVMPGSGAPAVVLRRRRVPQDRVEARDFILETASGDIHVVTRHVWLVHSEAHDRVRFVAGPAEDVGLGVDPIRHHYVCEQAIAAGDEVCLAGFLTNATLAGTAEFPLLVWHVGTELDDDLF